MINFVKALPLIGAVEAGEDNCHDISKQHDAATLFFNPYIRKALQMVPDDDPH